MEYKTAIQETCIMDQQAGACEPPETVTPATLPGSQNAIIRAAWMNQQGASCLLDGDIQEAAQLFSKALQLVRFNAPSFIDKKFPVSSVPKGQGEIRTLLESRGFVYSKPLFFNPEAVITEEDILSYMAVLVFNLGLAYQLEGHIFGDGGSFLCIAKALYETTLSLLNSQLRWDCSNIIIAALNNLACVNAELFMDAEAYQTLLLIVVMVKEGRVRTDTIHAEDFSDVILNIRLLEMAACAGMA